VKIIDQKAVFDAKCIYSGKLVCVAVYHSEEIRRREGTSKAQERKDLKSVLVGNAIFLICMCPVDAQRVSSISS